MMLFFFEFLHISEKSLTNSWKNYRDDNLLFTIIRLDRGIFTEFLI